MSRINEKQRDLYIHEWWAVRKKDRSIKEAQRHEFTIKALGFDKSHKDFTNLDLDKVLKLFRAITRPDDLNEQVRLENGTAIRSMHTIRKANSDYVQGVCAPRFSSRNPDRLKRAELPQLAMTLNNRKHATNPPASVVSDDDIRDAESTMNSAPEPTPVPAKINCPF